jgi:hypothetical protein
MKRWIPFAAFAASFGFLAPTVASADGDVLTNPYVLLYTQRLELAKLSVTKAEAQLQFDQEKLARDQELAAQNAVSAEELQDQERQTTISSTNVQEANIRVSEADALLQIAKARVSAGQDMPICSPEQ